MSSARPGGVLQGELLFSRGVCVCRGEVADRESVSKGGREDKCFGENAGKFALVMGRTHN